MTNNTNAYVFVNNDGLYISRSSKFMNIASVDVNMLGFTTKKSFVMIFDGDEMNKYKNQMAELGFSPINIF